MIIKLVCSAHADCPVVPAGDALHFISTGPGIFELDWADLYCTGGEGDHAFHGTITDEDGNWLTYIGAP